MTPRKQSTSPLLSYLLMGGILSFGAGAAYMVLSDSDKQAASAQKPPAVVAPAPVRPVASAQPALKPSAQAVRQTLPVTTPAPAATAASIPEAAAAIPAAAAAAQVAAASVPVAATPAAVVSQAPAPTAAPVSPTTVTTVSVAAKPTASKPVTPVAPATEIIDALRVAAPSSVSRVTATIPQATAEPVAPAKAVKAPAQAVSAKLKRQEPAKVATTAVTKPRVAPVKAAPVAKEVPVPVARPALPSVQEIPLPAMKNMPKLDVPTTQVQAPAQEAIVESRPESKPAAKANVPASDGTKQTVKSIRAAPLVPQASKPSLVMANGDKAWVKLDEQRTVIITKGQEVPGLGTFHGADKTGAKFDSGTLPLNQ